MEQDLKFNMNRVSVNVIQIKNEITINVGVIVKY